MINIEYNDYGYFITYYLTDSEDEDDYSIYCRNDDDWIQIFQMDAHTYFQIVSKFNATDCSFDKESKSWFPVFYFNDRNDAVRAIQEFYEPRMLMLTLSR